MTLAHLASAQLEHGFVEPCTMSNVEERHLMCELCPASRDKPGQCAERLTGRGYTKKCRTRGGHTGWEEIWCAPRPPPEKPKDQAIWVALGALGALAAMALVVKVISGKPKG